MSSAAAERRANDEGAAQPEPAGRCYRCRKPALLCVCARIRAIPIRTAVTIIQHPRERHHPLGTARIAALGLEGASIVTPRNVAERSLAVPPIGLPDTGLLFPSEDAIPLEEVAPECMPRNLIVLDGTWSQARGLYRENAWLGRVPHYGLTPREPSRYRIRREPHPNYVSTLEAIVAALRLIEPETRGMGDLLAIFDAMIDDQIAHARANRRPRRTEKKYARQARERRERMEATGCVTG